MYVFEYLRFNFKIQDFVMRLQIKAQIIGSKCVKGCALFVKNKVRFTRAE